MQSLDDLEVQQEWLYLLLGPPQPQHMVYTEAETRQRDMSVILTNLIAEELLAELSRPSLLSLKLNCVLCGDNVSDLSKHRSHLEDHNPGASYMSSEEVAAFFDPGEA
jgi:hypothetical protein